MEGEGASYVSVSQVGAPSSEPSAGREAAIRVLLLEDNPGDARLIREMLAETGDDQPALVHATTLASAIERAAGGGFDVVLLDLHVPDSQGLETLRRFQASAPSVPVVVLTGLTDSALALQAVQEGAQDFLVKGQTTPFAVQRALWYAIERKRSEEQLRLLSEASRRLARSFDLPSILPDLAWLLVQTLADGAGIFLLDADGEPRLAALEHRLPGRVTGMRRWLADQPSGVLPTVAQVLKTGEPQQHNSLHWEGHTPGSLDQPRSPRPGVFSLVSVPLVARHDVLGVLVLIRDEVGGRRPFDAADLVLLEALAPRIGLTIENARLYEQARDAVRLRDEFLMLVTHDLRNPLAGLRMQIEAARQRHGSTAPPSDAARDAWHETERLLTSATGTIDVLTDQVSELLDVARLQVGATLRMRRTAADLVDLARGVCAAQAEHARITFSSDVDSLPGRWDVVRLRRVLGNLLGNALRYSRAETSVEVTLARDDRLGCPWAVVAVADRGVGIPEGELEQIFQPFYRASNAPDDVHRSGLGLAGSRQIVDQHGGTLQASHRPGGGSLFVLRLPVDGEEPAARH